MKTKTMVIFMLGFIAFHFGYRILSTINPAYTIEWYKGFSKYVLDAIVYGYVLLLVYSRSWKPVLK